MSGTQQARPGPNVISESPDGLHVRLPVPEAHQLRESLETLFLGRETTVHPTDGWPPAPHDRIALYYDAAGTLRGAWMLDFSLAAAVSCALVAMPAGRVAEVVNSGVLDEDLDDMFFEVVNILGTFMNSPESTRLKLQTVGPASDMLTHLAQRPWIDRASFSVSVDGYGSGRITWAAS